MVGLLPDKYAYGLISFDIPINSCFDCVFCSVCVDFYECLVERFIRKELNNISFSSCFDDWIYILSVGMVFTHNLYAY